MPGFDGSADLYVGSLKGFRAWRVALPHPGSNEQPMLRSASFYYHWAPGVNKAKCFCSHPACRISEELVTDDCGHGFWAYAEVPPDVTAGSYLLSGAIICTGVVAGFGSCVVGPKGFRSMKAQLLALGPVIDTGGVHDMLTLLPMKYTQKQARMMADLQAGLAERYRVRAFNTDEEMVDAWPLTDTSDFLEDA